MNALRAMRDSKDVIGINLKCFELKVEDVQDVFDIKSGDFIKLNVSDTGMV